MTILLQLIPRAAPRWAAPFVLLFMVSFVAAGQELSVPELHRRVTDLSATLTSGEVRRLDGTLEEFEKATSNQVVVLMIPSLEGESLEDYSLRVCEKNKLGKKGRNNGVLLLIAKSDRKLRIEVGYGLEGALPDAVANQIIRHEIVPQFRSGDFYGGIRAGVDAIMAATKGEYEGEGGGDGQAGAIFALTVLFIIITILLRIFRRSRRMFIGRHTGWGPWFGGFGGGGGGGFGGGGGGGFGGGGGGGFSGGGGSFGGGGSSGSW